MVWTVVTNYNKHALPDGTKVEAHVRDDGKVDFRFTSAAGKVYYAYKQLVEEPERLKRRNACWCKLNETRNKRRQIRREKTELRGDSNRNRSTTPKMTDEEMRFFWEQAMKPSPGQSLKPTPSVHLKPTPSVHQAAPSSSS